MLKLPNIKQATPPPPHPHLTFLDSTDIPVKTAYILNFLGFDYNGIIKGE